MHTVAEAGVVKLDNEEYADTPVAQTLCTWNWYAVAGNSPETGSEVANAAVVFQVEAVTGLYFTL